MAGRRPMPSRRDRSVPAGHPCVAVPRCGVGGPGVRVPRRHRADGPTGMAHVDFGPLPGLAFPASLPGPSNFAQSPCTPARPSAPSPRSSRAPVPSSAMGAKSIRPFLGGCGTAPQGGPWRLTGPAPASAARLHAYPWRRLRPRGPRALTMLAVHPGRYRPLCSRIGPVLGQSHLDVTPLHDRLRVR